MKEVEELWQKYCQAKDRAEQNVFPIIAMFDYIICSEYDDLKEKFDDEYMDLFRKNINFILSKIS